MNPIALAAFGWLVPGGAYLLTGRYVRFACFAVLVAVAFAAGIALQGGYGWPQPADLQGLDNFTALVFQAGALLKLLAGGPFLLARMLLGPGSFLDGRLHEYGTTLLSLAGLINILGISTALESRKAGLR